MKKILVLALLLLAFNAKSQTKEETEKWLKEKLYAYSYTQVYGETIFQVDKIEVSNCKIIVITDIYESGYSGVRIETIPIISSLTYIKGDNVYVFKGNILSEWKSLKTQWKSSNNNSESWFKLKDVPDDMLERIQKALEHYRKLCGVDEPF